MCILLGLDPANEPASAAHLRGLLALVSPHQARIADKTLKNMRANIGFVLRRYQPRMARGQMGLSPQWQHLRHALPQGQLRYRLSRFIRFCSGEGVAPEAVDDSVFAAFADQLVHGTLVREPHRRLRDTAMAWNTAVAGIPGWPASALAVPSTAQSYVLAWEDLPPGLRADAEAWLGQRAEPDPFAIGGRLRALRPATINARRFQLRQLVSALAHEGYPTASLTNLSVLVDPSVAEIALRFFWERAGRQPTAQTRGLAQVIVTIAREHGGAGKAQIERLRGFLRNLRPRSHGLTARNRERLRQLDDPRNLEALLLLPQRVLDRVGGKAETRQRDALDVQMAVMLELLLMMPIRRANVVRLRIGSQGHLRQARGKAGATHIVIPGDEVKNHRPLEYPLPAPTARLLQLYITHYRPLLMQGASDWLFPGAVPGQPKSLGHVSRQFPRTIRRLTGLDINLHLIRHIGAKLYLDRNPGAYETVRHVLGHAARSTAIDNYTGLEADAALRHYDHVILAIRAGIRQELDHGAQD